jgi:hypothetical protein
VPPVKQDSRSHYILLLMIDRDHSGDPRHSGRLVNEALVKPSRFVLEGLCGRCQKYLIQSRVVVSSCLPETRSQLEMKGPQLLQY